MGTSAGFQTVTLAPDVTVSKFKKSNNDRHCYDVTVQKYPAASFAATRLCDHCGATATPAEPLNLWDWSGRPDGILLHQRCEEAWYNNATEGTRQPATDDLEDF